MPGDALARELFGAYLGSRFGMSRDDALAAYLRSWARDRLTAAGRESPLGWAALVSPALALWQGERILGLADLTPLPLSPPSTARRGGVGPAPPLHVHGEGVGGEVSPSMRLPRLYGRLSRHLSHNTLYCRRSSSVSQGARCAQAYRPEGWPLWP